MIAKMIDSYLTIAPESDVGRQRRADREYILGRGWHRHGVMSVHAVVARSNNNQKVLIRPCKAVNSPRLVIVSERKHKIDSQKVCAGNEMFSASKKIGRKENSERTFFKHSIDSKCAPASKTVRIVDRAAAPRVAVHARAGRVGPHEQVALEVDRKHELAVGFADVVEGDVRVARHAVEQRVLGGIG